MAEVKANETEGLKKTSVQDKIEYVKDAFKQRKEALLEAYKNTNNPLDRLSYRDKMEEMDLIISHLEAVLK